MFIKLQESQKFLQIITQKKWGKNTKRNIYVSPELKQKVIDDLGLKVIRRLD